MTLHMNEQSLYLLTKLSFLKTTIKVTFKTTLNLSVQKFETLDCMSGGKSQQNVSLQNSDKGQIFYWSSQTCSKIRQLFGRLVVTMLKKTALFQAFWTWQPNTFCPYCLTALVPPSTDPVPPSTNQYGPILTQYHHVLTITALCWYSSTKYQQVSPHTDPVP